MYSKKEKLAETMWKKLSPIFAEAKALGRNLAVRFDAHHRVTVYGSDCDVNKVHEAVREAEGACASQWDIQVISFLVQEAKKAGEIEVIWKTDPDTGVYIDWSEFIEFST